MSALHDDPRLTAYALGELDAAQAAEIEALLADDPAARAAVDEIRAVAALLTEELGAEAAPDAALREAIVDAPVPRRYWPWAAGTLAAAAAVFLVVGTGQFSADAPAESARARSAVASAASSAPGTRAVADTVQLRVGPDGRWLPSARPDGREAVGQPPRLPVSVASSRHRQPNADGGELPKLTMESAKRVNLDDRFWHEDSALAPIAAPVVPEPIARTGKTVSSGPSTINAQLAAVGKKGSSVVAGPIGNPYADANIAHRGDASGLIGKGTIVSTPLKIATEPRGADQFNHHPENPFKQPTVEPLSTFSIDVDTASYSMVRSMLTKGRRPPAGAVRIEELLNYFEYDYAPPQDDVPFATHVEIAAAPWAPNHRLVRVGLKGKTVDRPRANLVFLIDVSGSMSARNKLPLLKDAMSTLVDSLHPDDRVAIVVYAGAAGLVLPSTPAKHKQTILGALNRLKSGGSTNGGAGISQAYWVAAQNFIQGGVNRVIIGTDGDFNVGTTNRQALIKMVEDRAQGGIALTVLGFGMGNYNDATLEQLADKGDGNYAYIDTRAEARKVLVDQLEGTLVTIAKDVKIQVEFNPAKVARYRLIGYENRTMAARDFNDDTKDAGEIGAGHTVTALYEVVPTGYPDGRPMVDPLKYQQRKAVPTSNELLTLKLRYKAPTGGPSKLLSAPLVDDGGTFGEASDDLRFAASVAAFGMILRGSPHVGDATLSQVKAWAQDAIGKDEWGYRKGFLELVTAATRTLR